MNIFILSRNINNCARYHCDKHLVKMILEHTQILSTVCRLNDIDTGYKKTHMKHPCVIWAGQSQDNWIWLRNLNQALHEEYQYRYGKNKIHKSYIVSESLPVPDLPKIGMTPFAQAMPDKYKNKDPVKAYRQYYIHEKYKISSWLNREKPYWFKKESIEVQKDFLVSARGYIFNLEKDPQSLMSDTVKSKNDIQKDGVDLIGNNYKDSEDF